DWPEILSKLQSLATSEAAKTSLGALAPLANPAEAEKSFRAIEEAQSVLNLGERPFMESLDLFAGWFQRLKRAAVLTTLELRDVRHFCLETVALCEVLEPFESLWVTSLKNKLIDAT